MKPLSHLVVYRDSQGAPTRYFGPFVTPEIAHRFKDDLPEPRKGGYCSVSPVQPFTQHESHIVRQRLLDEREIDRAA